MRLPRISPRSWEHLSRTTVKELVLFGALGVLFLLVALFKPYNPRQPSEADNPYRGYLSLSHRLGYAILLNAGYGKVELVDLNGKSVSPGTLKSEQQVSLNLTRQTSPELQCLGDMPWIGPIHPESLTIAILAAEKYNRSLLQRRLKTWVAEVWLSVQGNLPEFSYGLGQIRPSTARRIFTTELGQFELSGRDLLALLMDPCQNIRLAAKHVEALCQQFASAGSVDEIIAKVALAYNGARLPTVHGLRYIDAVTGAYHLLHPSKPGRGRRNRRSKKKVAYIFFEIGESTVKDSNSNYLKSRLNPEQERVAESSPALPSQPPQAVRVHISFWNNDPGPKTYVARLSSLRREWIMGKLVDMGYPRDQISVSDLSSPTDPLVIGTEKSFAAIEIQRGTGEKGLQ